MEYYWICIRANRTAGLFKVTTNSRVVSYDDFEYIKNECGIGYAETVSFNFGDVTYMMLVDDEGKLKQLPFNQLASAFYMYDDIVGDVAILAQPSNSEMMYLLKDDADALFSIVKNARFCTIDAII